MAHSWKVTLPCRRKDAETLGGEIPEFAMMETPPVLMTSAVEKFGDTWKLEAFFEHKPNKAKVELLASLIPGAGPDDAIIEQLPDEDWVAVSQAGLEPLRVGRFFVHAQDSDASPAGLIPIKIEASQAFGTGHHETTAGCLAQLDRLETNGARYRQIADIGTGTGLLAFAALHLWPGARCIASDIDPVAIDVAARFADENSVALGRGPGKLSLVTASGTDHNLIQQHAPYDLLIANILAGPLIELAPTFAALIKDGGTLILAGLLQSQADRVAAAYAAHGLRLAEREDRGEWPTLRLTKRQRYGYRRKPRLAGRTSQPEGDTGEW